MFFIYQILILVIVVLSPIIILIRLIKSGYMFAEVPYRLGMREESVSKAISFPSLINVIKGYIKLVIDHYIKKDGKDIIRSSTTSKRSKKNKFYN